MRKNIFIMAVSVLMNTCFLPVVNAEPVNVLTGAEIFKRSCSECHAPGIGYPGTQQLARTRGEQFSILEQRNDLSAQYIAVIVRNGLSAMTPFNPTELTNDELEVLTEYLTAK